MIGLNNGTQVTIIEETDYPFDEQVQFRFQLPTSTQFTLYLRVPSWCQRTPTLSLNGNILFHEETPPNGSYLIVDRIWANNDVLLFGIPLDLTTKTWTTNQNAVSIAYGSVTFSLDIHEQYNRIGGTDDWPEYAVMAKSAWNYGLVLSDANQWSVKRRKKANVSENLFTKDNIPIYLEVRARRIPEWTADNENVVGLLPQSPVQSHEPDETITLVPMGAARLRTTAFPSIAE